MENVIAVIYKPVPGHCTGLLYSENKRKVRQSPIETISHLVPANVIVERSSLGISREGNILNRV